MNGKLALTLSMPVGLSIYLPNDKIAGAGADTTTGVGWNMGLLPGVIYFFTGSLGSSLELGWVHRSVSVGVEAGTSEAE